MMGSKKINSILFRCSEEDYDKIHSAALAENRTLSGFLLDAALRKIHERPVAPEVHRYSKRRVFSYSVS